MMMIGTRTTATMFGIVAAVAMIRMYMLCFEIATVMVDVAVLILMAVDTVAAAIDIDIAIAAEVRFVGSSSRNSRNSGGSGGSRISFLVFVCLQMMEAPCRRDRDRFRSCCCCYRVSQSPPRFPDRIGKRHDDDEGRFHHRYRYRYRQRNYRLLLL